MTISSTKNSTTKPETLPQTRQKGDSVHYDNDNQQKVDTPNIKTGNSQHQPAHDNTAQTQEDIFDTKNYKITACEQPEITQTGSPQTYTGDATKESIYATPEKKAEEMGWNANDTQTALDELQIAMSKAYTADIDYCSGRFADMPELDESYLYENNDYEVEFNGNSATITIRGRDSFSDVEIVTPFSPEKLESSMNIVGTSGQGNGLQFVQKGTNGVYNDQCFGMSAIYGSMLKGESAYLQENNGNWLQTGDNKLSWNNNILKGNTPINGCSDITNYTKMTFGGEQTDRQTAVKEMNDTIIENLKSGNPVIVEVGAIHNDTSLSRHYVTAIGYTLDEQGSPKDVIVWDPFSGDCRKLNLSYEEEGKSPKDWINGYDGDRIPVTGKDVGKTGSSDDPNEFQIFVWNKDEENTPINA